MRAAYVAVLRSALAGFCHKLLLLVALLGLAGQAMALPATSTVLTLSPASPVIKGQSVALTAVVTGAAPTGSVTFMNGSTSLGSGTLSGGTATLSSTFNTKGTFSITAVYGGDTKNAASTSAAVALNVLPTTTTTLSATPTGTVTTAQSVSLKATVGGSSPSGSVTFYDGGTSLGNVSVSSASATLATTFSTPGSHSITAAYSGDASNANSVSSATVISVISVTSNVVSASANPVGVAQSLTFTDTVNGNSPTGTVTFYKNGTSIGSGTVSAGQATFSQRINTTGTYSITATYGGDSNNAASTSAVYSLAVVNASSTDLAVGPTSTSVGQNVTLHAAISGGTSPGGTVTFYDGTTTLGGASVASAAAQLITTFASAGVHSISAVYSGDSADVGSTSNAVGVSVAGPTSTSLASSVTTVGTGKNVTLTATVSGTGVTPTGTVTFKNGSASLGNGTISGGQATLTTTFSSVGVQSLTAVYSDDTYNTTSTSPVDSLTVLASSTVALSATPNEPIIGQNVTLTAVVSGSTPSGSVTFMDGSTPLGSGTITSGSASLVTSFSVLGTHSITAVYAGDSNNLGASSSVSTVYVVTVSSTSVAASANPIGISQSVTLTASVSGASNYNGLVTFYDGSTSLGSKPAQAGTVPTLTTSFSTRGVHNITAVFGGDIYDSVSTSPVLALNVLPVSTTTLSGASTNVWGQGYTFTVAVSGSSPTGTVNVYFGTNVEFTGELNNGQAILSGPIICCGGSTPFYAVYSGDANNAPSTSANLTVNISVGTKPTLYLEPLQNVASIGETVVLNAGTHDALSHGSVTFYDGTTVLGTVPYTGDGSTNDVGYGFNFVPTTAGAHALKAVYTGASGDSTSVTATTTVQVTSTIGSNTLAVSPSPAYTGQSVTLTSTIVGNSPTGTVTFYDGATALGQSAISGGQASLTTTFSTAGSHSLTAVYKGDVQNGALTSAATNLAVSVPVGSVLTVGANPVTLGQSVALTAVITGNNPTGSVTFEDGSATLGSATLSGGQAVFNASFGSIGLHSLTVVYNGDGNNSVSTSPAVSLNVVTASNSSLSATPNPVVVKQHTILSATVSGNNPTGSVTFMDGSTTLGTASLASGQASYTGTFSVTGNHSLTVVYGGDSNNAASTSGVFNLNVVTGTSTTLTVTPNPAGLSQSVTLNAVVTGSSPSGTVTFEDGSAVLGSAPVNAGNASFTTSFSSLGTHSISAVYSGDGSNATSTSTVINLPVLSDSAIVVNANPGNVAVGVGTEVTATVTGSAPGGGVSFYDGTTNIGIAYVDSSGLVTLGSVKFSSAGTHNLTAVYGGDSNNIGSTSPVFALNVQNTTTTTLTGSGSTNALGQGYAFTVSVNGQSPTGTVSIYTGLGGLVDTSELVNGQAVLNEVLACCFGPSTFYAVYNGDTANVSSTSANLSVNVSAPTSPVISMAMSRNVVSIGETVILYAGVNDNYSNGNVTFYDGATTLGTLPYTSNYKYYLVPSVAGTHNLKAVFNGIDGDTTSISATAILQVTSANASNTLSASATTVNGGQSVAFTAAIVGNSPSGKVVFMDGTATLGSASIVNGQAVYNTIFSAGGVHSITAVYGGDVQNGSLTSNSTNITVIATSTTALSFSSNPAPIGQTVVMNASVATAGVPATGNVVFADGSTALATVPLSNGQASYSASYAVLGTHAISAAYSGDAYHAASTGSGSLGVTTVSVTSMTGSINPVVQGMNLTLNAYVSGNNPGGTFTFMDGSTTLGSTSIVAGQGIFVASFATVGNHSLTAVYSGDANNATSTSPALIANVVAPSNILVASISPAQVGQVVTLGVTIGGSSPSGTVTFMDGGTTLGSVTLANGQGSLAAGFNTAGNHSLTTVYGGDTNNPPSTSAPVIVNVIAAQLPPAVSLSAPSSGKVYALAPAAIVLQVAATSPASTGLPTGTIAKVDFYNGTALLGTGTSAPYTYTWNNVSPGTYTITAVATDNIGFTTTSTPVNVRVNAPPQVSITSPLNNAIYTNTGTPVTFVASATDSDGSIAQVQFYYDGNPWTIATTAPYTATVNDGQLGVSAVVTAVATDSDGATTTSAPVTVTWQTDPACVDATPASGTYTSQSGGTLYGGFGASYPVNSNIGTILAQLGVPVGTSAGVTITSESQVSNFYGITAHGITSQNAGAACGMLVSVQATSLSIQRNPSPMIAGMPYSVSITTVPANVPVDLSCTPNASGGYSQSLVNDSAGSVTGTASAAWVGIASTCVWNTGNGVSYTETVNTIAAGSAPINLNMTVNGVAGNSTVTIPTGQTSASVTLNGSASETGATISSTYWTNNGQAILVTSTPFTLVLQAGVYNLSYSATDNFGKTASTSQVLTVAANISQSITFAALPGQTLGNAPFSVSASASSNLAVLFHSATESVCTVLGSTVTMVAAGTCTITADQSGNLSYAAAPQVAQSFTVAEPTGSSVLVLSATPSGTSLPAPASITLSGTISPGGQGTAGPTSFFVNGTLLGTGTTNSPTFIVSDVQPGVYSYTAEVTIRPPTGPGGNNYGSNAITITVGEPQTITFNSIPDQSIGAAALTLTATVDSPLSITYTPSNPQICSVSGNVVSFHALGLCTIVASQGGGDGYLAAPPVTQSFNIIAASASQTITFGPIADQPIGNGSVVISASATSQQVIQFTSQTPSTCAVGSTSGTATTDATITLAATGPCTIAADQRGGLDGYSAAAEVTQTFNIVANAGPVATLSADPTDVRVTATQTTPITFTGEGSEATGLITQLDLYQNNGNGFGTSPIKTVTGSATSLTIGADVPLGVGLYTFKLRATDANHAIADSTPVSVSVTNSNLQGLVNGIMINSAGKPQLIGWVCLPGNSETVSYQVYANAPAAQGGMLLGSGSANVSNLPYDASMLSTCGNGGHDFSVDLTQSSYASYGGAPLYVQAADANNNAVLPCAADSCTMPGIQRIGLLTPSPTNTDLDATMAPTNTASVFLSALITGTSGPFDEVQFIVNGNSLAGIADTSPNATPGTYYAVATNLPASSTPYGVVAMFRQDDLTLYSSENFFTVVNNNSSSITLNTSGGSVTASTLSLSATVGGTAVNGANVQFYANGNAITSGAAQASNSNGVWTYSWNNAAVGTYVITARLLDGNGIPQAQSGSATIVVQGTAGTALSAMSTAAVAVPITPPYIGSADSGSLPGSVSVGSNGAATYSIPIAVPPGTAGLSPTVALNYSSLAGNGIPGYGWSLGGGSGIHRCVRTVAQDGYAGPVHLDATDALCLDGERLMLVSGTYGAIGSTYRTEIDNFARITAITGPNSQIAFTVETRDGKFMNYGNSADSAVAVVGKYNQNRVLQSITAPLFWDLTSVTDLAGNKIVYTYTQDTQTTGEHLLHSIAYGNGTTQYNQISFAYECRNGAAATSNCVIATPANTQGSGDADIEYLAGARIDLRHRLTTISTYTDGSNTAPGALVQTTTLSYTTSPTSQRSLLSTAQVCAASGACLPLTKFNWGTAAITDGGTAAAFVATTPSTILGNGPSQDWGIAPQGGPTYTPELNTGAYNSEGDPYDTWGEPGAGTATASSFSNTGIDYQKALASLITGDFIGDGKQRILTADQGEGVGESGYGTNNGAWHLYTINAAGTGFDVTNFPYAGSNAPYAALPTQLDFGVPNWVSARPSVRPGAAMNGPVIVGDFDGDGRADIAFFDGSTLETSANPAYGGSNKWVICLSRLTASNGVISGGFDCQYLAANAVTTEALNNAETDSITSGRSHFMALSTQANGRSDIVAWNMVDGGGNPVNDQRCSYVPPSGSTPWSWSCSDYLGVTQAVLNAPYPVAAVNYSTVAGSAAAFYNNTVAGQTASKTVLGDFWGTGQSSFMALRQLFSAPSTSYPAGQQSNADLFVAAPSNTNFNTTPVGLVTSSTYSPNLTNQFAWSNSSVATAGDAGSVISRFFVSESPGVEIGGTPLGDLNGDGYTDYLLTYEGHAEICYSVGIDGFDCRLMQDDTIAHYQSVPQTPGPNGITFFQPTVAADASGLFSVYSVLSVGHANDHNIPEVIYKRGDGGAYSGFNGGAGGPGGDVYTVCTLHDGMRKCSDWLGPNMRPSFNGYITYTQSSQLNGAWVPTAGTMNWPIAGTLTGDYTGHGRTEMLFYCNSSNTTICPEGKGWRLYQPNVQGPTDRLVSVVNGYQNTTQIDYTAMTDQSAYAQQTGKSFYTLQPSDGTQVSYPLHTLTDGRLLVSALHVDEGNGSAVTNYLYEGLADDTTGRGEQGFERVTVINPQGTVHSTQYLQGFPYTGMEWGHAVTAGIGSVVNQSCAGQVANQSGLLEFVCNTPATLNNTFIGTANSSVSYGVYPYAPQAGVTSIYPYEQVSKQLYHADLNGSPMGLSTHTIAAGATGMDMWGNVIQSLASTTGPQNLPANQNGTYTTTTANAFANPASATTTPYLVGQLLYTQVSKTAPGEPTITRTKQLDYYGQTATPHCPAAPPGTVSGATGATGLLKDEIAEACNGDDALRLQITYGRDANGNVAVVTQNWTDPVSGSQQARQISNTVYEPQGRFPQTVANALNQVDSYSFDDATGAKLSHTDSNNLTTSWSVDGFGRPVTETHPDHTQNHYYRKQCSGCTIIDGATAVTAVSVNIVDHVTDSTYGGARIAVPDLVYADTAGHHLRSQSYGFNGTEIDTDFVYDSLGRLLTSYQPTYAGSNPVVASTNTVIDELNRVTEVQTQDEYGTWQTGTTSYTGLSVTYTNALQQSKTDLSDPLGQLVETIDAMNGVTLFSRDAYGNLLQTTDPLGNIVIVTYDNLGRKTKLQDPDLGTISYGIDPRGLQYQQQNPNEFKLGQVTTFVHDLLDRLTARNEPDLNSAWVYDSASPSSCASTYSCGKQTEAYSWIGNQSRDYDRQQSYDQYGRPSVTSTTIDALYTTTEGYDNWGRPSTTVYSRSSPGTFSKSFAMAYNQYGYLAQVQHPQAAIPVLWQANTQDASDRVTQADLGNSIAIARSYSPYTGRLSEGTLTNSADTQVLQESYVYDPLGNVSDRVQYWNPGQASQNGVAENFQYDGLNRLANSTVLGQATQSFTYDAIGNITSKTGVGNYSYPAPGAPQPHAVSSIDSLGSFSYDSNGNMLSGAGRTYTNPNNTGMPWTSFDMPNTISESNGSYSAFTYGPEHQRTKQTRADMILIDVDAFEVDTTTGGVVTGIKTHWPMGLGLDKDAISGGASTSSTQYWTHVDRLGSVIGQTDLNGVLQEMMGYDAWGSRRNLSGSALVPNYSQVVDDKGFTGQEMLDQLGLVHLNGRVYDPLVGRFISADLEIQDPMHSQSYNRYSYVWNNPTNDTDPTGFDGTPVDATVVIDGRPERPSTSHGFVVRMAIAASIPVLNYAASHPAQAKSIIGRYLGGITLEGAPDGAAGKVIGAVLLASVAVDVIMNSGDDKKATDSSVLGGGSSNASPAPSPPPGGPDDPDKKKRDQDKKWINEKWHQGSWDSSEESLDSHYAKHGREVNATSREQYLRKAEEFSKNLRGAQKKFIDGATEDVTRYIKNGKYIDIAPDGRIVSFGVR